MKLDETQITDVANICATTAVQQDHALLLQKLSRLFPQLTFEHVLTRGGWHRPGGVITAQGDRIADHFEDWLESEVDDDMSSFIERYMNADYYVTRIRGSTHYFVAQYGDRAQEFVQLEVEALQEETERKLFSDNELPDDIQDLIDPVNHGSCDAKCIGEMRYELRRITVIDEFLAQMKECMTGRSRLPDFIQRFMQDWDRSSASETGAFSKHWVLSLGQYIDAWGDQVMQAKPVSTDEAAFHSLELGTTDHGSEHARLIHGFDRDLGYPMAWYFFMLSHTEVPHQLAEAIHSDLMGAYDYLPARDLKILRDWSDQPYGI